MLERAFLAELGGSCLIHSTVTHLKQAGMVAQQSGFDIDTSSSEA